MPTDEWLILAYIMIFSSVILCGLLPMIYRLVHARRRFHRYNTERQLIEYSCPYALLTSQSIYSDVQSDESDLHQLDSPIYAQIPFIDDDISV
jgi:hypothetical protein